ncbi:5-(carboxyamino)imidazole ribonucleotide mutase [Clostridiaceae bacterium HSG29]|nr:5-(carboxyamino)imidazole ribonucleotide mutase [Clostridiaceae bacterium HSG29]
MKVAVIMGSDSDYKVVKDTLLVLKEFDIEFTANVMSAHRTPDDTIEFAKNANDNGYDLIIGAAGKAAHLPGVIAAVTILPVIGLPIKSSTMDGLDSLLSIVQMPSGIPVATVAINGAKNAGLLAVQILSLKDAKLKEKFKEYKEKMKNEVNEKNEKLQMMIREEI